MITNKDKEILRTLASRYREISAGEENRKLRAEWVRFNDEKAGRPKVIVDEIPWQEMQWMSFSSSNKSQKRLDWAEALSVAAEIP